MAAEQTDRTLPGLLQLPTLEARLHWLERHTGQRLALPPQEAYCVLAAVALGQQHIVEAVGAEQLARQLLPVERFYEGLGGIVGYHTTVLALMREAHAPPKLLPTLVPPPFYDLRTPSDTVRTWTIEGIRALPHMAEIYPVGGAGDRLNLHNTEGRALPAACLPFAGHNLLELLFRDLMAREALYERLFHKRLITPVVLMTSDEKHNDAEISTILERASHYGRPRSSFFRLIQPLTPVIGLDGQWVTTADGHLLTKPGGHGVIWQLARTHGAFDWLRQQGRTHFLVRQINNPLAGLDDTLLAFLGIGCTERKSFGFIGCKRRAQAPEGILALEEQGGEHCITNVEYTKELPADEAFPANTNILFGSVDAIEEAVGRLPIPGMLVNLKQGHARLESTMQNIADALATPIDQPLRAYIALADRAKAFSAAKRARCDDRLEDTPEGALRDLLQAHRLLLQQCGFAVHDEARFLYNPILGPLYALIQQKLRGGALEGELQLEIADVALHGVRIRGGVRIEGLQGCCSLEECEVTDRLQIVLQGRSAFEARGVAFRGGWEIEVPDGMVGRAVATAKGIEVEIEPLAQKSPQLWHWGHELRGNEIVILKRSSSR